MKLTREETQALSFIAAMVLISIAARIAGRPGPVEIHGAEVSIAELQAGSLALMDAENAAAAGAQLGWVNLNTASVQQIAAMPEVGDVAAALIVTERARSGTLEFDVVRQIAGLKKKTLESLAQHASFGTWDDPGRMTPPPGLEALEQKPQARRRPVVARGRAPAPASPPPVVVRRERAESAAGPAEGRVAINRATAEELQRLPGVGPALAQRILAHRQQHGPFRTLADLDAVSGIGPALLSRIGPLVDFL